MTDPQRDPGPIAGLRSWLIGSPWPPALAVAVLALTLFAFRLGNEPHFVDESAYISQSYYAGLLFEGKFDDPLWLEYEAFDLPPLPKYIIGAALELGHFRTPGPTQSFAWYHRNTRLEFVEPAAYVAARIPMVFLGAIGCLAVYGIGLRVGGRGVGFVAAALLAVNPLYRMLARRAMSDVPCEAFLLLGLLAALIAWESWQSREAEGEAWGWVVVAGLCSGLSLLCKFSGALTLMVVGCWGLIGLIARRDLRSLLGLGLSSVLLVFVAGATFVALNPVMTARPTGRLPRALEPLARKSLRERWQLQTELRLRTSAGQQESFPHNALRTPAERVATVAVQGFGRFGPLGPAHTDSTRRYDLTQDWGALAWAPCVLAGVVLAAVQGCRQRRASEPTRSWLILVHFVVATTVVAAYLPMAWDRYLLPLQAPAALLVANAFVTGLRQLGKRPAADTPGG